MARLPKRHVELRRRIRVSLVASVLILATGLIACTSSESVPPGASDASSTGAVWSSPEEQALRADFRVDVDYDFDLSPTYCPVRSISFVDQSAGAPTGWLWEFPDGETSTEQNPIVRHAWVFGGTSSVKLTITRGDRSDDVTREFVTFVC